ncbi:MAG: hypothetical protein J6328_06500, partial [Bacilli bacterium]|nr:hypothetical protein [Bacilli bacterium]
MKTFAIADQSIIIAPREEWDELFAYRRERPEISFSLFDKEGVESLFLAHSDARALRLLLSKGYSLEKSKDILSSLRYWKGEIGGDAKLEELSSLYLELRKANYLYYDVYPERSFKGKDVYILGYPRLPRVESLLKGVEGTRLIQMEKKCSALPPL